MSKALIQGHQEVYLGVAAQCEIIGVDTNWISNSRTFAKQPKNIAFTAQRLAKNA